MKAATPKTSAPTYLEQTREISLHLLDANPWNPNEMSIADDRAARESLLLYGFVVAMHARPHPTEPGRFQLINGENRTDIMRTWVKRGLPADAHPSLADLVARAVVPVTVLEGLSDADAMRLTPILNHSGTNNRAKLGELLTKIRQHVGPGEALVALPYSDLEAKDLAKLGAGKMDSVQQMIENAATGPDALNGPGAAPNSGKASNGDFIRFTVSMPREAYDVYQQALDLVKETLDAEGYELHRKQDLAAGQIIEALAAEYLAIPSLRNSGHSDDA